MCKHRRTLEVQAKCSDMCAVTFNAFDDNVDHKTIEQVGYVPSGLGIGSGDYIGFTVCLDCHVIVRFPTLTDEEVIEALS